MLARCSSALARGSRWLPLLLFVLPVELRAQATVFVADDFDDDIQNRVGGYRNVFQRAPSSATSRRVSDTLRGRGGKSLQITAERQTAGFCGQWIHLFDLHADQPAFFDARRFRYLSFWVLGETGGESFVIRLADRKWVAKEDSVALGHVGKFLRAGVTRSWQEVVVPLDGRHGLDLAELGSVTLEFDMPGEQTVYLDDITFKTHAWLDVPLSAARPSSDEDTLPAQPRAMWVWSTKTLLPDEPAWRELIAFCRRENVRDLWMQLVYKLDEPADESESEAAPPRCTVLHEPEFRRFLRAAHARGLRVHALDGYPEFCQQEFHRIPLAIVDGVIAFNRGQPPAERFDGVHFDNEPHLLVGWQNESSREKILVEFLELNAECQRRARRAGIEFGVDIPFWWQEKDARGRPNTSVEFRGKRAPASHHCIDLLDNVGVMNYRDTADGADGMIFHGRSLLAYADRTKGARLHMGIETFAEPPQRVWFAVGLPRDEFRNSLRDRCQELAGLSRFHDLRLRTLDDGRYVHVGVELPAGESLKSETVLAAMRQLIATECGCGGPLPNAAAVNARLDAARQALEADPEWGRFSRHDIEDAEAGRRVPGFVAESVMLSKITFGDNTAEELRTQTDAAEQFFRRYRRFGGLAIHFYETYRKLVEGR